MYARRDIVSANAATHVMFRCHDRNFFLKPKEIKSKLLGLLAKYKSKYRIQIFDFIILDNHVHLYLRSPNAECLGSFMRTVESQLARFINKFFDRDSQALRERYKSPVVSGFKYSYQLIQYIYLNLFKVNGTRPDDYYFCSAYWRKRKPHKLIEEPKTDKELTNNLLAKLLDDYDEPDLAELSKKRGFLNKLIDQAIKKLKEITGSAAFTSAHTINDPHVVAFRAEQLSSRQRERGPSILDVGMVAFGGSPERRFDKKKQD
jgi:REP element-mobilizing transposase RayT